MSLGRTGFKTPTSMSSSSRRSISVVAGPRPSAKRRIITGHDWTNSWCRDRLHDETAVLGMVARTSCTKAVSARRTKMLRHERPVQRVTAGLQLTYWDVAGAVHTEEVTGSI